MKNILRIVLGLLVIVVLGLCGGLLFQLSGDDKPKPVIISPSATTARVVPSTQVKKASAPTIGEGTWEVGVDVQPGKYKTAGANDSISGLCYWDVRKNNEEGDFVSQGVIDSKLEPGRVTLVKGQFFKTSGCQDWVSVK